ncbi:OprO/OprP family phosphate-selective porin [Crenothrix sp.]|uniref:OprO/OprP family phosphate-selective porin n=1 Tax=Crenothrix sp. TaxID=3100433 RepID=UPI00374C8A21
MKQPRLTLAIATALTACASSTAFAIDLYVDTRTQQIYAEPGPHRELMGSFERKEDKAAETLSPSDTQAIKEDLEAKTLQINALKEHVDETDKIKVKMDEKGLQVETADKKFKFKLGGRIQADASFHNGDVLSRGGVPVEANDGTELRRGRIRFEGVFGTDWLARLEADFANDRTAVKDAFIQYTGLSRYANITVGQQKQNFSRELQESSNDMMFTERSLMNILAAPVVDRAIGLNFTHNDEKWMGEIGIFGDSITPPTTAGSVNTGGTPTAGRVAMDEGWGISSRFTYNPIIEKTKMIHLGVAGNYRKPDDNSEVAKSAPLRNNYRTTNMSDLSLLDSSVFNVTDITMLGLEAGAIYKAWSTGFEYTQSWINCNANCNNADTTPDVQDGLSLNAWYGEIAYTLTGESRGYKNGNFGYLKPARPFSLKNGGWGAWELATRYSEADLNDGNFNGGGLSNVTVALNWYINNNFRLMANYTRMLDIRNSPLSVLDGSERISGDNTDLNTFMLRAAMFF